jgi:hypothetical protein
MKSTLLALALASVLPVLAHADDKDTPKFFAVGGSYTLRFADNGRVLPGFAYHRSAKVIAAAQNGWYRIGISQCHHTLGVGRNPLHW